MKQTLDCYAIIPPDDSDLDEFVLIEGAGTTPDRAWEKFCSPALRREGYEADGFAAKLCTLTIETKK